MGIQENLPGTYRESTASPGVYRWKMMEARGTIAEQTGEIAEAPPV